MCPFRPKIVCIVDKLIKSEGGDNRPCILPVRYSNCISHFVFYQRAALERDKAPEWHRANLAQCSQHNTCSIKSGNTNTLRRAADTTLKQRVSQLGLQNQGAPKVQEVHTKNITNEMTGLFSYICFNYLHNMAVLCSHLSISCLVGIEPRMGS